MPINCHNAFGLGVWSIFGKVLGRFLGRLQNLNLQKLVKWKWLACGLERVHDQCPGKKRS